MEKIKSAWLSIAAMTVLIAFQACSAELEPKILVDQEVPEIVKSELDQDLIIEEIIDDVLNDLEQFEFKKSEAVCPVITVEKRDRLPYPKVITKDFGDGCINDWGVEKSGKVIITLYGPWLRKGSVRTVEFMDYTHREIKVEGKKVITCLGLNKDSLFVHTIIGKVQLTKSDSTVIERQIRKKRTMLAGFNQTDVPKEWLIEGGVKIQFADSTGYIMKIREPLHHIQGCRWPQQGVKVIFFNQAENVSDGSENENIFRSKVVLDYSLTGPEEGACDSFVLRTVDDGEPVEVNLRKRN